MPSLADKKHGEAVVKRVSRKHDEEAHGSAWKVAFADFCLALMCLFLVLWVMAARNAEQLADITRTASGEFMEDGAGRSPEAVGGPRGSLIDRLPVPDRGDDPNGKLRSNGDGQAGREPQLSKTRFETASDMQELADVVKRLSAETGLAGNLLTEVSAQGLRVMLHDTDQRGMFARGSALPSEPFRALLRKMGPLFARIENQMLILGHTDAMPYADVGPSAYSNWTLSNERAMRARINLLAGGMRPDSVLQVVGMADRAPLDPKNPRAAVNRRIELLILSSEQARSLSATFGMPAAVAPLIDGVNVGLPRAGEAGAARQGADVRSLLEGAAR
ncbi:MAG: OmpA family protein [Proteobacteria bacterium]|nr:OmpA family protein [Pseudomonadota bacterium]